MMFKMSPKITFERLAEMIQAQFTYIDEQFKEMRSEMKGMATKEDVRLLREDTSALGNRLSNEIDRLRDSMRLVKTKVGIS